ncbi:MAG: hypothetical protein ACOVNL_03950 [Prochlorococcaceae cyanobacterium]|jgi:hypothetical protein
MATQPVQAVLYRILGNDLPPRYSPGQTLSNLQFTLENEPELPGLEKRWLLNRIVCPETLAALQATIRAAGQRFDVIPFEEEAYRQVWTDLGDTPPECHPWCADYQQLPRLMQLRIIDYIARFKNQYLMNNNAARNCAIALGLEDAEWVLPWDGGCFLPAWAWAELQEAMHRPELRYLCIPMHRLRDLSRLPTAEESEQLELVEPQLALARSAALRFDPALRYGSGPKWQFLQRIGLPGPWQHGVGWLPWEEVDTSPAPDAGAWQEAGIVLRLSCEAQDGRYVDENALWRLRFAGILRFTLRVDRAAVSDSLAHHRYRCWTRLNRNGWQRANADLRTLVRTYGSESSAQQISSWERIGWLALDAALNRSEPSEAMVLEMVQRSCLDAATAWSPAGLSLERVADFALLHPLLDAFMLLRESEILSADAWHDLQQWCRGILDWLTTDSQDFLIRHQARGSATWHHLLILSLATFLGIPELCCQVIDNLPGLLVSQFQTHGAPQPRHVPLPQPDETFSQLLAWQQLALLSGSLGRDLKGLRVSSGLSLSAVFAWACRQRWPWPCCPTLPAGSDLFRLLSDGGSVAEDLQSIWSSYSGNDLLCP